MPIFAHLEDIRNERKKTSQVDNMFDFWSGNIQVVVLTRKEDVRFHFPWWNYLADVNSKELGQMFEGNINILLFIYIILYIL